MPRSNSKGQISINMRSLILQVPYGAGGLLAIFAVALLSRIIFVLALKDGFYFPDAAAYTAAAVNLLSNGEFGDGYNRAPVYPVFLAGIFVIFGEHIAATRIVEAVLGACLAVVIAIIAKRSDGDAVGALAGLLWSLYPLGIFIVGLLYPTNVATVLLACGILSIVTHSRNTLTPERALIGGFFLGLTALTIPVALLTVVTIILWMAYWETKRRLILLTLFLVGVAIPVTAWTVRNFNVHGRLVIVEPRLIEHIPAVGEARENKAGEEPVDKIEAILRNPDEYARRFMREFRFFWELYPDRLQMSRPALREQMHEADSRIVRETVFGTSWTTLVSILSVGPIFFFALIGIGVMGLQKEHRRALTLLGSTILSFAIGYSFFLGKIRYRVPVEPYIMILSAYGLRQMWLVTVRKSGGVGARIPQSSEMEIDEAGRCVNPSATHRT
jgi:4-amino-4-deoxy-L-arabinose transferase-like glycosyltransferase